MAGFPITTVEIDPAGTPLRYATGVYYTLAADSPASTLFTYFW